MATDPEEIAVERGETTGLTESERYRLLANERRRIALAVLADRSTPIGLDGLAEEIASIEGDVDAVDEHAVRRVSIALHHNHLPRMADVNLITYDRETKSVEKRNNLGHLGL